MKHLYVFFLLISSIGFAQIPNNYYDSANGLSGFALKTQLKTITTTGSVSRSYDQLYDGNGISGSQGYIDTHSDVATSSGNQYESDGTILDMYSENPAPNMATDPDPNNNDPYNYNHGSMQCGNQMAEGDCYNREHLVPQSSFNSAFPMQSDIHHVIPTDGRVNNFRGSLPFGIVDDTDPGLWTSLNGSKRGNSDVSGYSGDVFEPIDEFKGDIARALLYFVTRYEDTVDGYTSFDMFNGTNDQAFQTWAIDMLLDWHYNIDPVDQRERDRNNAAYNFQGNANPFVDHPEYAAMIWDPMPDTEAPTNPTNLVASNPTDNTIDLSWTASSDNIAVVSYDIYVDGANSFNTTQTTFTVTMLSPDTNYCFTIKAKDGAGNESGFSNQDCETTTDNGSVGGEIDLFISEYVEGSSNNKAIEIANFTGSTVNLSAYTIARNTNGGAAWGPALQLTGSITNQDVHVVAKGNADQAVLDLADQTSSADAMLFNGDDPVGLFKDGELIDVFGYFNELAGTNAFDNETYRRNESVEFPTTVFNLTGEWTAFPNNTFDGLGTHNQTLNIQNFNTSEIKLFPNPVKGNIINISTTKDLTVEIFDVLGKKLLTSKIDSNTNQITISSLKKGVYLVRLNSDNGNTTRKLIKQ